MTGQPNALAETVAVRCPWCSVQLRVIRKPKSEVYIATCDGCRTKLELYVHVGRKH